jgi:hypothetical protein
VFLFGEENDRQRHGRSNLQGITGSWDWLRHLLKVQKGTGKYAATDQGS